MSDKNISVKKDANGDILSVTLDFNTYKSLLNPIVNPDSSDTFDDKWQKGITSGDFRDKLKKRISNW